MCPMFKGNHMYVSAYFVLILFKYKLNNYLLDHLNHTIIYI
jgi:hypothetical protein